MAPYPQLACRRNAPDGANFQYRSDLGYALGQPSDRLARIMGFGLSFWGVRGSIACPSADHVLFGGNTSCIELHVGARRIVLDAGTGLRELGNCFSRENVRQASLLLTHTHWDHINGFPFFTPAYAPGRSFRIMAGHLGAGKVRSVLAGQMAEPVFPVPLETMRAELIFDDFTAGDEFMLDPEVRIRTAPLCHPNGATGYRIEYKGKSVCYVTDTEHVIGRPDERVLRLIDGADLVIYDATYTDLEFPGKIGWGHSTWEEGIRLCQTAHVKRLAIFHHAPEHDDQVMLRIEKDARRVWDGAFVAREKTTFSVE
jgi:phosphoribosyl 1,2-cyclic phosphodiesterase